MEVRTPTRHRHGWTEISFGLVLAHKIRSDTDRTSLIFRGPPPLQPCLTRCTLAWLVYTRFTSKVFLGIFSLCVLTSRNFHHVHPYSAEGRAGRLYLAWKVHRYEILGV